MKSGITIVGPIVHCLKPYELEVIKEGFILVDGSNGKILHIGESCDLEIAETKLNFCRTKLIILKKTQLLLPGFIDTHIHAPQYPNAGLGYDKPLLEWLDSYTYKLERQYKDQNLCEKVFNAVVAKTLSHGTTTACYFGSLYCESTLVLANAVAAHGQRALVGKINMIRLAPEDYLETSEESVKNTLKFIGAVKSLGNPLIQPVITPRFAISVDMDLMKQLGAIARDNDLHIQSHISENKDELQMVQELFNDSYANVYHTGNLLTPKTIMAHGIYLSDDELDLIQKTGTGISHCPESNTFLTSGLCDIARFKKFGINVGLGTDVAGGPSPSIISAMKAAIGVSNHISFEKDQYTTVNYRDAFYMATLGGAKALAMDKDIGNFVEGKSFDAVIVDLDIEDSAVDYIGYNKTELSPEELLQKLIFCGDDRNVLRVFVNGKSVK